MRSAVYCSPARLPSAVAALALFASSFFATAQADPTPQTPTCHDARTGNTFTIHAAKFAVDGSGVSDSTIGARLCVGAATGVYAVPVTDGAGGAFVVWIESSGEDCNLRIQHVLSDGTPASGWPQEGRVLCVAAGTQTQPVAAAIPSGGLWAAWKDYRDPQHPAVYFTKLSQDGTLATGFPADGSLASSGIATDPQLSADGTGGVWLAWLQGVSTSRDLRLQHFDSSGQRDVAWPAEGRVIVPPQAELTSPRLAAAASGAFFLAWRTLATGADAIRLTRFDNQGANAAGWTATGEAVANGTGNLVLGSISADSAGASIAWSEEGPDSTIARIQSYQSAGGVSPGWSAGGQRLGAIGTSSTDPFVGRAPSGLRYVGWVSYGLQDNTGNVRLLSLGVGGAPTTGWTSSGVPVTSSALDKSRPRVVPVADGVLCTWSESADPGRGGFLASAVGIRGPLPDLRSVESFPDLVRLTWAIDSPPGYQVFAERLGEEGAWLPLKELQRDATNRFVLADAEVASGQHLSYRLRLRTGDLEAVMPEVPVVVAAAVPLAIRGLHAGGGRLHLFYSVPARGESQFELFDVQGRRLLRETVKSEHAGILDQAWPVPSGVRAGVYFARLVRGRETRNGRFVLAR